MAVPTCITGKEGSVTFASGYTLNVISWSCTLSAEMLEATKFGELTKRFVAGLKEGEGEYTCRLDQAGLGVAAQPGAAEAAATFTYFTLKTITGPIIISSLRPGVSHDGSSRDVVFAFKFTDTITIT